MSSWSKMNMPDSASSIMEQLMFFHDHTIMILIVITSMVMFMTMCMWINVNTDRNFINNK